MRTSKEVKINFKVQVGSDGYPPVAVESLWAQPVEDGYIIDSIPFFTSDATSGDRIRAQLGDEGALWFAGLVERSGNSLIRVVFFDLACEDELAAKLKEMGCGTERMPKFKLMAINVPSEVDLAEVQAYLGERNSAGLIDYEEPILRQ
jgi:hypothetical protein